MQDLQNHGRKNWVKYVKYAITIMAIALVLAGFVFLSLLFRAELQAGEAHPHAETFSGPIEEDQDYCQVGGDPLFYLDASGTKYYLMRNGDGWYNETDLMLISLRLGLLNWEFSPSARAGITFKVTGYTHRYSVSCWTRGNHTLCMPELNMIGGETTIEKG